MTNATEQTTHDCYWCLVPIKLHHAGEGRHWISCQVCGIETKLYPNRAHLVEHWNSLASRLKPEPKKVTIKRWFRIIANGPEDYQVNVYKTKEDEFRSMRPENLIDTVEVEITFTDRRGCEQWIR